MPKRFVDTELWDKVWFMNLTLKLKCLTRFVYDKCDASGVWSPNWILASAYIGEPVSVKDLATLKNQFEVLPDGKVFVVDFIRFQYGELSDKCKPHQKVISLLKKHGLFERVSKGYTNPINRVEEEEEYKDQDQVKDKDQEEVKQQLFSNEIWLEGIKMAHRGKDIDQAWKECYMHFKYGDDPPRTIKGWQIKLNTWLSNKRVPPVKPSQYQKGKFVQ
jgi:hypothetical protein